MKALALVLMVSACSIPPVLTVARQPVCPGCMEPYPQMHWSLALYRVGTHQLVLALKDVYPDEVACHEAGWGLENPDIYPVCRPLPNA